MTPEEIENIEANPEQLPLDTKRETLEDIQQYVAEEPHAATK